MEFTYEQNRIFLLDDTGKLLAEVTFPDKTEHIVDINHTFVDDSLRGQGVAGKLLESAANLLRSQNKKVFLSCSYAVKWFEKHPEYRDLLES